MQVAHRARVLDMLDAGRCGGWSWRSGRRDRSRDRGDRHAGAVALENEGFR